MFLAIFDKKNISTEFLIGLVILIFLVVCGIQVLFNEFKALVNQKNVGLNNFRYGCTYRLKVNLFQTTKLTKSQLDPFLQKIIFLKLFSSFFSLGAQTWVLMQTNS